jgi:hypothetical protein
MPMPTVYAVGTAASGTGAISPGVPAGTTAEDVLVLFVESDNQAVPATAGYAEVLGSPISVSTGTTTRLTVRWHRAVGDESGTVSVADPGDHAIARIVGVRGVIATGDPWNATAAATELVADTSASCPTLTTTVDNCLVLAAVATGTDVNSTAHVSGWANAALASVTERCDDWTTSGTGGGFGVCSGTKATAGAVGVTTATLVTANFKALMTIALKEKLAVADPYDIWTFGQTMVG